MDCKGTKKFKAPPFFTRISNSEKRPLGSSPYRDQALLKVVTVSVLQKSARKESGIPCDADHLRW